MTNSTASADGIGPFETRFQTGAAALSGVLALVAVVFAWTGYQGSELFLVGTELNMLTGATGFMLLGFFAVVSLVAALYMEPGFDH